MKFAVVILACVVVAAQAQFGQINRASAFSSFGNFPQRQQQQARPQQYRPQQNRPQQPFRNQQPLRPFQAAQAVAKTPVPVAVSITPAPAPIRPIAAQVVSTPVRNVAVAAQAIASRSGVDARSANVLKYGNEVNPDGSYNYFYETDNGIAAQAQGSPRNFPGNPPVSPSVVQGSYSWTSPEGEQFVITYVADENGYQPQGNAIPTPPPVPPQIARSLEYIARVNGGRQ